MQRFKMVQQEEREYLKKFAKGRGIDIGCGAERIAGFGIDNDPACNPDVIADMHNIPLKGNKYDFIIACHCLEHTVHTIRCLKEWHRLLKVEGRIAIAVPNGEKVNTENLGDRRYGHVQLFSLKTLSNFLEFVGFKIVKSTYFDKKEAAEHIGQSIIVVAEK